MAHFAELNDENEVTRVIVIANEVLLQDGQEIEQLGIDLCHNLFGEHTKWKQTSYHGTIRKNFASAGYIYDPIKDAFIPPKPIEGNWILNDDTCRWEPDVIS